MVAHGVGSVSGISRTIRCAWTAKRKAALVSRLNLITSFRIVGMRRCFGPDHSAACASRITLGGLRRRPTRDDSKTLGGSLRLSETGHAASAGATTQAGAANEFDVRGD